ncbi:MAG: HU family DNA-binding protein [Magnetococcales bacterium]|nr:HU family DNA-binding protein [Magnetococcales bacterium]
MNLTDLKKAVSDATGMKQDDAEKVIKAMTASIEDALKAGDSVVLVGFGTFAVAERSARKGRNPATGQEIQIPASKAVKFKPGKTLKEAVAG